MADPRRTARVAAAIRQEVANFLAEGVKDPRVVGLVTVTAVDVSRDLGHANVFVSVLASDDERAGTLQALQDIAPPLRGRIGRALRLRAAPGITFRLDESVSRAARIHTLLNQIKADSPGEPDAPVNESRSDDPAS